MVRLFFYKEHTSFKLSYIAHYNSIKVTHRRLSRDLFLCPVYSKVSRIILNTNKKPHQPHKKCIPWYVKYQWKNSYDVIPATLPTYCTRLLYHERGHMSNINFWFI
jgi:hypothetical protein